MKVLTTTKTIVKGSYTYNLMSNGMVHIDNHKTKSNSVMACGDAIKDLLSKDK